MSVDQAFSVEDRDGVMAGPVRRPANISRAAAGSIHDDETAHKLGFRGGTVAGNIHFEQFPPLLIAAFGEDWMRTGGLSLYFLNATTDGEPVQAFVGPRSERPEGGRRAQVWMEDANGLRVCEGTASVGPPDSGSALRAKLATVRKPEGLRILARSAVGDRVADVPSRLDSRHTTPRLEAITEPMAAYRDPSLHGELVAAPSVAIDALRVVEASLFRAEGEFVGMFGAIELQFLDGPVFVDHDYLAEARLLALSESPKTEVAWYESRLSDAKDGRAVAQLIMMTRLLKESSPLWTQPRAPEPR